MIDHTGQAVLGQKIICIGNTPKRRYGVSQIEFNDIIPNYNVRIQQLLGNCRIRSDLITALRILLMNSTPRDTIYSSKKDELSGFSFNKQVASVFPDMISRSVPGYNTAIEMLPTLAELYIQNDSRVYDLGCSLGASTLPIMNCATKRNCKVIGIDNSESMLEQCQKIVNSHTCSECVELICTDLQHVDYQNASMVIMNYTMQFVPIDVRLQLLTVIQESLLPDGVLVLSEKITFPEPQINQDMIDLHEEFKRSNGYSELEISQKRAALENVLIPEHLNQHRTRLFSAGFSRVEIICQVLNFCTILAIK